MKNFISKVFMTIVTCLFCLNAAQAADTWSYPSEEPDGEFGGGSGTVSSPYLINNAQQLADLAWLVNDGEEFTGKYFKLTTDITLNDIEWSSDHTPTLASLARMRNWTPIGKYGRILNDYFEGIFDGDGHTIYGLVLKVGNNYYTGLFGAINNAIIRNLNIEKCYLHETTNVGKNSGAMLVTYMRKSQMVNCHVKDSNVNARFYSSTVFRAGDGKPCVGGLVAQGSGDGKSMTSCSFDGYIHVYEGNNYMRVAGLMALGSPTLNNCKVSGTMEITLAHPWQEGGVMSTYYAGLCDEAEDINGCICDMDFIVNDEGLDYHKVTKNLYLFGFCREAKQITKSAYIGKIKMGNLYQFNSFSMIGTVYLARKVSDCAFYCQVDAKNAVYKGDGGTFNYSPFLTVDVDNMGRETTTERVVVLNGDEYFSVTDTKHLKKVEPLMGTQNDVNFVGNVSSLLADDVLVKLNQQGKAFAWGQFGSGEYKGCPLPIACGGKVSTFQGDGTTANPYLIGSEAELRALSDGVKGGTIPTEGKYFALTSNLDLKGTSTFPAIGTSDNPFRGTFNGRGYAISNIKLESGLFGYLGGTVKNLAVIGAELNSAASNQGVLAYSLGDNKAHSGKLTNCYAGGDITVKKSGSYFANPIYVGGLCGRALKGEISDCYFKGNMHIDKDNSGKDFFIGGLIGEMGNVTVKDSYASYDPDGDNNKIKNISGIAGSRDASGSVKKGTITNCYYVCGQASDYDYGEGNVPATDKVTKCTDDSEIFSGYDYTGASTWAKGAYRPVLRNAHCYPATAADGSYTHLYLDGIPMMDSKNTSNDILHFDGNGYANDNLLWALPNLAIYSQADKSDYILNCTLDPAKPLNYNKMQNTDVESVKVNMHYPLALTTGKSYYPLCLPGTVQRGDFPFGSLLYIGGEVKDDNDGSKYINIVQADSVAGGVPFVAYIPSSKTGETIDIVMRSRMAQTPLKSITDGTSTQNFALTGTYKDVAVSDVCTNLVEDGVKLYLKKVEGQQTMVPFTAYLENEDNVELRNYVLLDEMSNDIADVIVDNDGKNVKTMLKRSLVKDKWNTICLPTNMQSSYIEHIFGTGTKLECLSTVETAADGGCTLIFTSATDIEAGKSYLIKPANDNVVYNLGYCNINGTLNPSDISVTIDGTPATIKFCGSFERKLLGVDESGDDSDEEYFTQDNKIYHVGGGQQIILNGFRCYITANEAAAAAMAKARMVHGDGSTTALRLVEVGSTADGKQRVYDLQGVEQNTGAKQHGVYIKGGRKYVK